MDLTKFTATNYTLSIDFMIQDEEITVAKQYMLKKYRSKKAIDPHVFLVIAPFTYKLFDQIKPELESYFKNLGKFSFKLGGIECVETQKFFSIEISDPHLVKVHNELTELANKYRGNFLRTKDLNRLKSKPDYYSKENTKMIIKNGFPYSGVCYHPHVTIGDVDENTIADLGEVKKELEAMLDGVTGKEYEVDKLKVEFRRLAEDQKDMKLLKEYEIELC